MQPLDEEELIKQLHTPGQQTAAFERVVNAYGELLYWQIRRMVYSHDDANDVLQNTFVKAWTNIGQFKGDARMSTWLYRIATNESLAFLQKKRKMISMDASEASLISQLRSDTYFDGDETALQLQQAIATLPDKQRIVFNMKYFQEMKYEDMSEILQTSVGALKASYHFAVKKITDFFDHTD